tara:strand:- start:1564 stop:2490 length:927 start_codon:yes stop_codon:yes gene_type:complete
MKRVVASGFMAATLVLLSFSTSSAHLRGDRNWAAVQVPIGMAGVRDVQMDGDLGEWDSVPSVFWVTHNDLIETVTGTQGDPDPSNLAERIIFGWSPTTNLLYFMEEKFDDHFYGTIDNNFETVEVTLDFDHSADAIFQNVATEGLDAERWEGALSQNYRYELQKEQQMFLWGAAPWAGVEPYSGVRWETEGDVNGGATTLSVEMWFTPFDDLPTSSLGINDPDVVVHTMTAGTIMGIGFAVQDDDNGAEGTYSGYWTNGGDTELYFKATAMVDYVLLPYDESIWVSGENVETAIEENSWGRIKAGFSN